LHVIEPKPGDVLRDGGNSVVGETAYEDRELVGERVQRSLLAGCGSAAKAPPELVEAKRQERIDRFGAPVRHRRRPPEEIVEAVSVLTWRVTQYLVGLGNLRELSLATAEPCK